MKLQQPITRIDSYNYLFSFFPPPLRCGIYYLMMSFHQQLKLDRFKKKLAGLD